MKTMHSLELYALVTGSDSVTVTTRQLNTARGLPALCRPLPKSVRRGRSDNDYGTRLLSPKFQTPAPAIYSSIVAGYNMAPEAKRDPPPRWAGFVAGVFSGITKLAVGHP
jgi:hypothetical protein